MARRYDPDRRQRIVDAAVRVVTEHGIAGLTHRAVAAEADVPLGSTTYHFAGRDELLAAALERMNDAWLADLAERLAQHSDLPPAERLARYVAHSLGPGRAETELCYELYFAGLRHPTLRPLSSRVLAGVAELLRPLVPDPVAARLLTAALDGLLIQLLLSGDAYDERAAVTLFERVLAGPLPATRTGSSPAGDTR
ncbi:TetR/AcrR family transcriptional regulator [Streptomyces millisiae]|uniref:TetR family transcriptional regulator n=1 Tax=Streptomyces millisiae TaxID=3075542 RepID=A0ABU2LNJ1_9ACTN|nr:TetR family transcriptional regulator [Streptomyces sp. DSM 44918]MDT0319146.1 TetR family transcriptional regulator [Streptomyces sp. DSM 44918]